jgi:hypothetical protein
VTCAILDSSSSVRKTTISSLGTGGRCGWIDSPARATLSPTTVSTGQTSTSPLQRPDPPVPSLHAYLDLRASMKSRPRPESELCEIKGQKYLRQMRTVMKRPKFSIRMQRVRLLEADGSGSYPKGVIKKTSPLPELSRPSASRRELKAAKYDRKSVAATNDVRRYSAPACV